MSFQIGPVEHIKKHLSHNVFRIHVGNAHDLAADVLYKILMFFSKYLANSSMPSIHRKVSTYPRLHLPDCSNVLRL